MEIYTFEYIDILKAFRLMKTFNNDCSSFYIMYFYKKIIFPFYNMPRQALLQDYSYRFRQTDLDFGALYYL